LEEELEQAIASRPMRTQPEPQAQVPRYAQRLHEPEISDEALISANTTAAVNSAFNTLAQTVLVQNGRTLEDLVREMLRPMLKVWLDDNLPGMVERLVRAEIERVSRGRG
jgi:cell pole-organizing protein PopZ